MDCTHRFGKIAQLFTPSVMSLHVRSTANQWCQCHEGLTGIHSKSTHAH
jgi:hypothetical protein